MVSDSPATLPPFVQLAGHPLRWRVLQELAASDRRVRELVAAIGEPQNLISYHLGKLRSAGLVTTNRSSADGRDIYYHLDLGRCADAVASAATALHPAIRFDPNTTSPRPQGANTARVLFLCTGNSARSPTAATLLRHRADGRVEAASAGSHPKPLHRHAVRALHGFGIDLSGHQPRHLDSYAGERFDVVVSLCDRVREVCPEFPGHPRRIHWSIPDPGAGTPFGATAGSYEAFRRTAVEIDARIRFLIPALSK